MELWKIAVRALFAFVFLHALTRLSGKRFVAQATGFDFVLALILGDMIDDVLWAEVPVGQFVVAAGVLAAADLVMSMASFASEAVSRVANGHARMFVRDGSLLTPARRAERMSEKEAEELLRTGGLQRAEWWQIRSGWLERNGRLGLLKKDEARPVQKRDLERLRRLL